MSVCSSVGLVESARSSARLDGSIPYLGCLIGSVHCPNTRFVAGQMATCQRRCWRSSSSTLVLLHDTSSGACWISVRCKRWFTKVVCYARALVNSMTCRDKCCSPFRIGRAWKECASLRSGRVVDSRREMWVGKCQIRGEMGWKCPPSSMVGPDGWDSLGPTWAAWENTRASWATGVGCSACNARGCET